MIGPSDGDRNGAARGVGVHAAVTEDHMAIDEVRVEKIGAAMEITLNRPKRKNALTLAMYEAMSAALADASADPAIRVVSIRGEGNFTSGNDLQDFLQAPPTNENSPVFRFLMALLDFDKPLVAIVDGPAVGVGTTMLLHCDLVYAGENARFQLPFVNLALIPEAGSSYLLPKMFGHQKASELLLFGDAFDAATAKDLHLVNAVVPSDDLLAFAREKIAALCAKPARSLRLTKKLLHHDRDVVKERMGAEAVLFGELLASPELAEAIGAFFEKRAPDFTKFA
jgi:enoyl-CoA hydratase/carnithine racemase